MIQRSHRPTSDVRERFGPCYETAEDKQASRNILRVVDALASSQKCRITTRMSEAFGDVILLLTFCRFRITTMERRYLLSQNYSRFAFRTRFRHGANIGRCGALRGTTAALRIVAMGRVFDVSVPERVGARTIGHSEITRNRQES